MNVQELRIGNWFVGSDLQATETANIEQQVKTIQDHCGDMVVNGFWWDQGSFVGHSLEDMTPILLTEEWFNKIQHNNWHNDSGSFYLCTIDTNNRYNFTNNKNLVKMEYFIVVNNGLYDFDGDVEFKIEYLHDAQNKWVALTGKELEVKDV